MKDTKVFVTCRGCGASVYRLGLKRKLYNVKGNRFSGKDEPHTCPDLTARRVARLAQQKRFPPQRAAYHEKMAALAMLRIAQRRKVFL